MALQGGIPVEFGEAFPEGAYIKSEVEKLRDFDKSSKDNFVQARDKDTGLPVWQVEIIDGDKTAKGSVKVKLLAEVQPVPPASSNGSPFAQVEFDGLTVTPYVDSGRCKRDRDRCGGRIAYSFRAKAMRAPKPMAQPKKEAA